MSTAAAPPGRMRWRDRPRWLRWTSYALVLLLLAVTAIAVTGVVLVRRSFPQTTGTIDVPGLTAPVRVVRDAQGIPQLYAETAEDLFLAQGFVHAQDRFYEMDMRRRATAGRLSEVFGEDTLETDQVVRTLGWRRVAEAEVARLGPAARRYLEAYSAGVNAYLADRSPAEISLEYTLLGLSGRDVDIEPWVPADSVAWLKAMAWDLRRDMQDEVDKAALAARLEPERIAELYPPYPFERHRAVVQGGTVRDGRFVAATARSAARVPPGAAAALEQVRRSVAAVPALVGSGDGIGSNAWVVAGSRSTTGAPLLANDPHLAATLPGVWTQMGLHCSTVSDACPFDVAGFTFSGFPGVVIGHNADIAWGFTNLGADVTDLYLEAVEGERYLRGRRWVRFERREETIEVAGGDDFTFTVRTSLHGPLLSDVSGDYASVGANAPVDPNPRPPAASDPERGSGYAVALAWTALQPSRTAEAVFAINRAGSWREFRDAARDFAVPSQNLVYADRAGRIGYQVSGLIPERPPAQDGTWPAPGWDRRFDWTGDYVPFDELPSVLDPAEGFIASANQAPVGPSYPRGLATVWDYGYRSQRITDLLSQAGRLSPEAMAAIQRDTRNELAPVLVPYLLDVDPGSVYYRAGQRLLRDWDFTTPPESPAAAYFSAVWRHLLLLTFTDELPERVPIDGGSRWWQVVELLLEDPASPWWDDVATDGVREGRDDILRSAMRIARDELTRLQSRRADDWAWGHQHTLELENQTVGQSDLAPVRALLNRGPWELGGSTSVVDATAWDARVGYEAVKVPSMRMVVSLADLDASRWVNLTGASGHAFSPHYTDQTDLWARGETLPWAFTAEAVEAAGEDVLTLQPSAAAPAPTG